MSISSIYGSSLYSSSSTSSSSKTSKMAEDLFSALDTSSKGYLELSDLESALTQVSSTSDSSDATASDIFNSLDSDGDGKVTQEEFSSTLQSLSDELSSQLVQSDMPPPPPPPSSSSSDSVDEGYTQDELTEISETTDDSGWASLTSSLASNFDVADTNGDGKITGDEAMAYQQSVSDSSSTTSTTASTDSSSSDSSSDTSTTSSDAAILKRIMELMQAYTTPDSSSDSFASLLSGSVSVSA